MLFHTFYRHTKDKVLHFNKSMITILWCYFSECSGLANHAAFLLGGSLLLSWSCKVQVELKSFELWHDDFIRDISTHPQKHIKAKCFKPFSSSFPSASIYSPLFAIVLIHPPMTIPIPISYNKWTSVVATPGSDVMQEALEHQFLHQA